jgi:cytochrome b subunit of formate dehydrogenase
MNDPLDYNAGAKLILAGIAFVLLMMITTGIIQSLGN